MRRRHHDTKAISQGGWPTWNWLWYATGTVIWGALAGSAGLCSRFDDPVLGSRIASGIWITSISMIATIFLDPLGGGPVEQPRLKRIAYPIIAALLGVWGTWLVRYGYRL